MSSQEIRQALIDAAMALEGQGPNHRLVSRLLKAEETLRENKLTHPVTATNKGS